MGDDRSGHIVAAPNESIIFFDNLFPLGLSNLIWRPQQTDQDLSDLLTRFNNSTLGVTDPIHLVQKAIPKDMSIDVTTILPRLKEGGAFLKFSHPAAVKADEIQSACPTSSMDFFWKYGGQQPC